jgi:glycosyltransferase involved in cell wall biosynthesis
MEILVVDNGSTDDSPKIAASFSRVTLLQERRPGSYAARNTGLARASGKYVMFLDADCRPNRDWIRQAISAATAEPNLGVIAGRIELESTRPSAASLYESIFSFDQQENVRQGTSVAANWLSPKAVLDRFGGFDASLRSGGDTKLSLAIRDAGYAVLHCQSMIVYHPVREGLSALLAKRRRVVGGKWAMTTPSRLRLIKLTALVSWDALRRIVHVLKRPHLQLTNRLKIVGIIAAVWTAGVAELTRLAAGSEPRR